MKHSFADLQNLGNEINETFLPDSGEDEMRMKNQNLKILSSLLEKMQEMVEYINEISENYKMLKKGYKSISINVDLDKNFIDSEILKEFNSKLGQLRGSLAKIDDSVQSSEMTIESLLQYLINMKNNI